MCAPRVKCASAGNVFEIAAQMESSSADHGSIAHEAPHPEIVAENHDVVTARSIFFGQERTAPLRHDAEHRKQVGGNACAEDSRRFAIAAHGKTGRADRCYFGQLAARAAKLGEGARGDGQAGETVAHFADIGVEGHQFGRPQIR